jgi:3-methyladenine DNA glycosylase AlkD
MGAVKEEKYLSEVLQKLKSLANPEVAEFKAKKFGIPSNNALGVFQKDISQIAKETGKNSPLAIALFETEIYEAKLLASKIFKPRDLTKSLVKTWTSEFDNWEICDSFSMAVYAKSPLAYWVIDSYRDRTPEFERRTAFATMAGYCSSDKKAENKVFESYFESIIAASTDDRNFVRKAVNWALRSIGKRNKDLNILAQELAQELSESKNKTARWIGSDADKELSHPGVRISDYPRHIYRPLRR